jgi:hypothetical protein
MTRLSSFYPYFGLQLPKLNCGLIAIMHIACHDNKFLQKIAKILALRRVAKIPRNGKEVLELEINQAFFQNMRAQAGQNRPASGSPGSVI